MKQTQPLFPEAAWLLSLNNPIGLYLHVPFCNSKCAYCDFYSYRADVALYERYCNTLCRHIRIAGEHLNRNADTLYFGGGTPSLLGGERIAKLVGTAKESFGDSFTETTVECNPAEDLKTDFELMAKAGVNRISLGVQSGLDSELKALSRRHTAEDVVRTVTDIRSAGIHNISLDLMLGIPHQTKTSLKKSLDFLLSLEPTHISAYMLKIEPDTPFGKADISSLDLPDEDTVSDMYLFVSQYLSKNGFEHYEISNFAKQGYRSKHNTRYWLCDEYLGLGPSAYSYLNGKRFSFDRNCEQYLTCPEVISDGEGGDFNEYCMLRLRLSDGIDLNELSQKYGNEKVTKLLNKAKRFENSGLLKLCDRNIRLTVQGFLVSNAVIGELLF